MTSTSMNVTVTPAIMPVPAWTSPTVIHATAHVAGWEQTAKSVSILLLSLCDLPLHFHSMRRGCASPTALTGEAVRPKGYPEPRRASRIPVEDLGSLCYAASLLPESESSLSTRMRMCRCHPEFAAAKTAKNVLSREALESHQKRESLC